MELSKPQTRTILLHAASAISGAVGAVSFAAAHSIDLYAAYDHLYAGVKEFMAAWLILGPIIAGGYAAYKAGTKNRLIESIQDPRAVEIAKQIPPTPEVRQVADALKAGPAA